MFAVPAKPTVCEDRRHVDDDDDDDDDDDNDWGFRACILGWSFCAQ